MEELKAFLRFGTFLKSCSEVIFEDYKVWSVGLTDQVSKISLPKILIKNSLLMLFCSGMDFFPYCNLQSQDQASKTFIFTLLVSWWYYTFWIRPIYFFKTLLESFQPWKCTWKIYSLPLRFLPGRRGTNLPGPHSHFEVTLTEPG